MAEEKAKKKEPGIYKRIQKWIGLTLLVILIMLALIFQAPWKVIALLLIIIAACIVLPKPYRKWFWLSVAAIVLVLIIWIFLPDDNKGWRSYTFDEELAALETKYAVPDEDNAALIYSQILEDYSDGNLDPNLPDYKDYRLTIREPWSSKDYLEIAQWLERQETIIIQLFEASRKQKCYFPLSAEPSGQHMNHTAEMRRWAEILICAGNNDIAERRIKSSFEKYLCTLKIAEHQRQQPAMIDSLVGIAIEALVLKKFNTFIISDDSTEEHLALIEKVLADIRHDWGADWLKFIENEKFFAKTLISSIYEKSPKGKVSLSWRPIVKLSKEYRLFPEPHQTKLVKVFYVFGWFVMPSTPQRAAKIIDTNYKRYYAMANPSFDWQQQAPDVISLETCRLRFIYSYLTEVMRGMPEKLPYRIHDLYLRYITKKRGCQILIALKRHKINHGQWPENLEDVKCLAPAEIFVEPFNKDVFVYKLTNDSFTLYSKGKNSIDEQAQYNADYSIDLRDSRNLALIDEREDDILIWPPKTRKKKE